jgi:hypothetical protein
MKKNKLIALFAGLSLAFVGSAALAAPSADTLLVAGYDAETTAVLYGISDVDQDGDTGATLDCSLVGDFQYTVGEANEDGVADVDTLQGDDTTFEAEDVVDDDEAPDDITYDDLYGSEDQEGKDCLLTSVTITPNGEGEVNHGTVVSTFARLLQGGNGCMIKLFAQSGFGKDGYEDAEGELAVTLDSIATACSKKGKSDSVSGDDDDSESRGKANAPGQQDKTGKGKDNAPGQTKVKNDDSSSD